MLYRSAIIASLESNDLVGTIAFYRHVLGFAIVSIYPEEGKTVWATLEKNAASLMVSERNAHTATDQTAFTGSFYFYPDNVDACWAEVLAKIDPSQIEWPIETFDYGMREFGIRDPNGYLLRFGQPVEELVP